MKGLFKQVVRGIALLLALPAALLAGFGRFFEGFVWGAQALAMVPGLPGSYLRVAYYSMTLEACGRDVHIALGSYFSNTRARVGNDVSIGAYCVLGRAHIGDGTQIASGVQILSGRRQHSRDEAGRLAEVGRFEQVRVGSQCWIGAAAVVMANLEDRVTVGAGSVVTRDVADGVTVVGNPARVLGE